jgi:DNA polymerase
MKSDTSTSMDRTHTTSRSAADFFPTRHSLKAFRDAAAHCEGCELFRRATQTVFGRGAAHAALMLIGEVPGDREDVEGKPFVGPAGKLLDEALAGAGLERGKVYLTNAVKHFKWEPRGKRRLHAKPSAREIAACRPWLEAEIDLVRPQIIVCLGATAAQSLLGNSFRITKHLGELLPSKWSKYILATYHPSSALRAPEPAERQRIRDQLVHDLKTAASSLK